MGSTSSLVPMGLLHPTGLTIWFELILNEKESLATKNRDELIVITQVSLTRTYLLTCSIPSDLGSHIFSFIHSILRQRGSFSSSSSDCIRSLKSSNIKTS
uniref:Uncharacterized protein n=1 Tax=Opuntia streptacantha TaxID=393608 RepID=A0A7C9AYP8_OPUST